MSHWLSRLTLVWPSWKSRRRYPEARVAGTLSHQAPAQGLLLCLGVLRFQDPSGPHKHQDLAKHDFWYPPYIGPWNPHVRSSCLSGHLGPIIARPGIDPKPEISDGASCCWSILQRRGLANASCDDVDI